MKFWLATGNRHKHEEFARILKPLGHDVLLPEGSWDWEVEETGETFVDNALLKAYALARFVSGDSVLADDSGLSVAALNGAPGVRSARYAPPTQDQDTANREKLHDAIAGIPNDQRNAAFHCALIWLKPDGSHQTFEGIVEGKVIDEDRGDEGFGYDPMFVPKGYSQTTAEMSSTQKDAISHRGRAVAAFLNALAK